MKTGKTLQELANEVLRQAKAKHDYIAPPAALTMLADEASKSPKLALDGVGAFGLRPLAHGDLAELTRIPKPYYDRCLAEAPELLANNVNAWLRKLESPRMVRTLDEHVRCLASDAYRPLDNFDLANAVLPVFAERKLQVMSCELTEKRLYIKAVDEQLYQDVPVGYRMGDGSHRIFDTCAPVVIVSNSEVGYGRLSVETGVYTRACTNMCLYADGAMKRTHLGGRHKLAGDAIENIDHLLSDKTKRATDAAIWMQVRDIVAASFDAAKIGKRLEKLAATAENKITGKVAKVVEVAAVQFGLNAAEQENVLQHLIEGGSLTQYGLHAAITRSAQDATDYDRATELEYLGGKVIELDRSAWEQLAEAA